MGINSHQAGQAWCEDGAFITQFDLDSKAEYDPHDSPVVGRAKCSRPRPLAWTLISGIEVRDSVALGGWVHFKIEASGSDTKILMELYDLSNDLDLYVKKGSRPTLESYDCRPYSGGTTPESCNLINTGAGPWYISVHGFNSGSFRLKATLSELPKCEGDFDIDGDVDGSDLALFAADFGRTNCSGDCEGDFDEDNDVDGSDLATFAADFGRTDCLE